MCCTCVRASCIFLIFHSATQSGAAYVDHIVADRIVAPPDHALYFSESILHLSHHYQVCRHFTAWKDASLVRFASLRVPCMCLITNRSVDISWCVWRVTYVPFFSGKYLHLCHDYEVSTHHIEWSMSFLSLCFSSHRACCIFIATRVRHFNALSYVAHTLYLCRSLLSLFTSLRSKSSLHRVMNALHMHPSTKTLGQRSSYKLHSLTLLECCPAWHIRLNAAGQRSSNKLPSFRQQNRCSNQAKRGSSPSYWKEIDVSYE